MNNTGNKNSNHNNGSSIINNNNKNDTMKIGFKKHYTAVTHLFLTSRKPMDKH